MCIVAFALHAHPDWPLVVIANRDEYHSRASAPLAQWPKVNGAGSGIVAGRDLVGGGTWLGISESGRLVLVTNFRVPGFPQPARPSRGGLVTALLEGADPLGIDLAPYNPFSLLVADADGQALLLGNYPEPFNQPLPAGVHGLSNGPFTPAWPKTQRLCGALQDWLNGGGDETEPLFTALRDESPAESAEHGPEPRLSSVFILDAVYGTRCSTVVAVDRAGQGKVIERRFDDEGLAVGEVSVQFGQARTKPTAT